MTLDLHARHRLTALLADALGGPGRLEGACGAAGLAVPPTRGVDPLFARVSALLLPGPPEAAIEALIAAASAGSSHADALASFLAPPEPDQDELATVRVLDDRHQAEQAPPRPPGTPAEAPPREGAKAWLRRRAHLSVPTSVAPGGEFDVQLTLAKPGGGAVPGVPEGAPVYEGAAVAVAYEFWLEEAFPADEAALAGTVSVDPAEERAEAGLSVRAAEPLGEGVDVLVRFFVGGYEVGRARAFVPNGSRDDVEPRPAAPGALAVPDSIVGL